MRGIRTGVIAAALAVLIGAAANAQTFPQQAVTMIVPFPPGGGTDTGSRLIAQKLSEKWGQQVVVDNKPGAAGIVGLEIASKAKPDGYTIVMGNIGTQAINQSLYKKLPYNSDTAFTPITLVAELPLVLVVNPSTSAKTTTELIALAKSKPGELTYSTSGNGSSMHLAAALFENQAGLKFTHVPYKGGGPAMADLMAGQVDLYFGGLSTALPHARAGKMRALGQTLLERSPAAPDIPTIAEAGLPGYEAAISYGIFVPAGTPALLVGRLHDAVDATIRSPEIARRFTELGADPQFGSPAEFATYVAEDLAKWARLAKEAGLKAE